MGNEFQFMDIIFFAMIAVFLILRLRGVLGRRDGHENKPDQNLYKDQKDESSSAKKDSPSEHNDNVVSLDGVRSENSEISDEDEDESENELIKGIMEIRAVDQTFDPDQFIDGAGSAFDIIINSFAAGEKTALKPLLSDDVYRNFVDVIEERERSGHHMEETLIGIKSVHIVEAYMEGKTANVTVKFVSEQVNAILDENKDVVEGNPNLVVDVVEFWTFSRDVKSKSPNWTLSATRSLA